MPLERFDLALLLGWATAALGDRPALPSFSSPRHLRVATLFRGSASGFTLFHVGAALADTLVVMAGTLVISLACGMALRTPGELVLLIGSSAFIGAATSLQVEVIRLFANRAAVLLLSSLLTALALHLLHASPSFPAELIGRIGFPVSAIASATEEPSRLDLAARALAAGVTYDLALVATLLALLGNRARG